MDIQGSFSRTIKPQSLDAVNRLMAYRNEDVLRRYMEDNKKSREEAERAWTAFLQFMAVCMFKNARVTATPTADGIWHSFLLHTKQYREFCDQFMGGFVDHEPTSDEGSSQDYDATRWFAMQVFGSLDERDWPTNVGRIKCYSAKSPEPSARFN